MSVDPCWAANGMNAPGYGAVQLGLAGAGTAMVEDSFATVRNPAAGVWLSDNTSFDLGVAVPSGGSTVGTLGNASQFGLIDIAPGRYHTVKGVFPIPSYARNWRLSDRSAIGWGVVASGLVATSSGGYGDLARGVPTFSARCDGSFGGGQPVSGTLDVMRLCGGSDPKLGVNLMQVLVSGHYAYKLIDSLSFGVAPVFAAQRILIRGLGAFAAFSNFPGQTTGNGFEYAYGGGARVGLLWDLSDGIGLGVAYQSRLYQTRFERYQGAIIGGPLDFAPTLNLGLQLHVASGQRLLFDVERIQYGVVRPLGAQVDPQRFSDQCFVPRLPARSDAPAPLPACLGGKTGPGFGWRDISVFKIGYQATIDEVTGRAGFSWGGNPVNPGQTLSRFFAPAITDQHAALGLSWKRPNGASFDMALVYAIKNRVRERNVFSNAQLTLLNGTLVGFQVNDDPQDQEVDSSLQVWEAHLTYSWPP